MRISTCLLAFLFCAVPSDCGDIEDATLSVQERVSFLKYVFQKELKDQMGAKQDQGFQLEPRIVNEHYDYVDLSQVAITPINENDDRKQNGKFKLRQLKTTRTTKRPTPKLFRPKERKKKPFDFAQPTTPKVKSNHPIKDKHAERHGKIHPVHHKHMLAARQGLSIDASHFNSPMAEFYKQRRYMLQTDALDTPIEWTHCQDLITPFLTGVQKELTTPVIVMPNNRKVLRLIHLIQTDVTRYTKQDIYSLMYQISNVQIRLFTWDPEAIRDLLSAISPDKKHSFKSIKNGIKRLFEVWHLAYNDDSLNLLKEAKVFRPPCLPNRQEGSTKTSKRSTYTTKGLKLKGVEKCSDETQERKSI